MAQQTKALLDEICGELAPCAEDDIFDMVNAIQDCERTDVEEMMQELEENGYLSDAKITEEGSPIQVPYIEFDDDLLNLEIGVTYLDGNKLAAYIFENDFGTFQAGTMYYTETGVPLDLTLSEIKKGDLAEAVGLQADNMSVDLYVWSDPFEEGWTDKFSLSSNDIKKALDE